MRFKKLQGFFVAVLDDLLHLRIDNASGLLPKGLGAFIPARHSEIGILSWCQLHHPQFVAHAPAGNHATRKIRRLLDIALRAGSARVVYQFLSGTSSQHPDNLASKVAFRIVVAIRLRTLVRDPEGLATRHYRYAVHRIGTGNDQTENGMSTFVVRNALPVISA